MCVYISVSAGVCVCACERASEYRSVSAGVNMHVCICVCCFSVCVGLQDFSALRKDETPLVQETSQKRIVIGPLDLQLHSSAVHRILKMAACTLDHEYQPYCKPQPGKDHRQQNHT